MNVIYIHDAGDGKLIITGVPDDAGDPQEDYEETVEKIADANGMHFGDCSWGSVGELVVGRSALLFVKKSIKPGKK